MKSYLLIFLLFGILPLQAQSKASRIAAEFEQTQKIVNSNHFKIDFTIATTYNSYYMTPTQPNYNENIRIEKDSAYVIINDTIAEGFLPYFGSGYSFPQVGAKGIVFANKMLDKTVRIKGKKGKRTIAYEFMVVGLLDSYRINLDIQYDGTCYLFVNSTKRSPITYQGKLYPIQ